MTGLRKFGQPLAAAALAFAGAQYGGASSHMDAPLITFDDPANLADVYAFVAERDGVEHLVVGLSTYPFEEPGVGPNKYNFDPSVLYQIHLSLDDDLATGADSLSYQFRFQTDYKNEETILQSYTGVVNEVDDSSQNLTQTYSVTLVDNATTVATALGVGVVPPNNQGIATPKYNVGDNGENPAKPGVATEAELDPYTGTTIAELADGYRSWAGQRDDGFYGDVQAIFDLLNLRDGRSVFDSQSGFNTHVVMLEIPLSEIGGNMQSVGVHATTSRRAGLDGLGPWTQVGRLGNPLFNEAMVAIADKNLYNITKPVDDAELFQQYAETPELAALINALVFDDEVAPTTNRSDLVGIFIPDLLRVDLSTGPARLPGSDPDEGYSRLGIFGEDTLTSQISEGFGDNVVSGGWPNGRRLGDDVVDIAITAIISDLRTDPLTIRSADGIDNVDSNDAVYNKVFPYAATPHNGRNHVHNSSFAQFRVPHFINMSTRGFVNGEDILVGGFIIVGDSPLDVIVRGRGPSMNLAGDKLADPMLEIKFNDEVILTNDDWRSDQEEEIMATGFAPPQDTEAAALLTAEPGVYVARLSGKDASSGHAIVEVFANEF